ncbi:MAG: hypothetical protein M3Q55_11265 [Acidobacteriota bacterium]|nr:hypothetical protein [Acidobacteriota bacterium]
MSEKKDTYAADDFNRRSYTVEGPDLEKAAKIELIIKVDGKTLVHMAAREPGLVAFVSRPTDQGFSIEIVQSGGRRYVDFMSPADLREDTVLPWQIAALGLSEESR